MNVMPAASATVLEEALLELASDGDAYFVLGSPSGHWLLVTERVRLCRYFSDHEIEMNCKVDMIMEGEIDAPENSCSFPEHGLYLECGCRFVMVRVPE